MGLVSREALIDSIKPMEARRNIAKKRSLLGVNEHFERYFNAAYAALAN
jgi:hypothetical protein